MDPPAPLVISEDEVAAYEARLAAELPRFAVRYKDESGLQRAIAGAVWPFNREYLTRYTTVMFGRVYFPSRAWRAAQGPAALYCTLRHEAAHLRDARRYPLLFHVSYLLLPLPFVFTARAFWEWRGYRETLRAHAELYGRIPDALLDHVTAAFTGPDYLFMCPFRGFVRRRLERLRDSLVGGG